MTKRSRSEAAQPVSQQTSGGIVNGFWYRDQLCFVQRGGTIDRKPAEYSLFIKAKALTRKLHRELSTSNAVVSIVPDGHYMRVRLRAYPYVQATDEWLAQQGVETFEADVNPLRRYMADNDVQVAKPRLCYLDIETDSRLPFNRKEEMRILAVAIVDGETGQTRLLDTLGIFDEHSEAALLSRMWKVLGMYDQVAAWNGDRFDFPVIKARTEKYGLKQAYAYAWRRWLWLDHLELFRRMNQMSAESGEEKTSFSLEAISQSVLGYGKVPFDASKTYEAWTRDTLCGHTGTEHACNECRACMVFYCEHDTRLMYDIEQKTGYIQLLLTLSQACNTFPDSRGINPTGQVEGFLLRLGVERGYHYPTSFHTERKNEGKYEGAFVMQPTASGITKDVHVADFSGLYPNIMVSWNMSTETLLAAKPTDGRPFSHAPIVNTYFDTSRAGVLPSALLVLMKLRKKWNDAKARAVPGSPEWHEADRRSAAYKIAINSFYGVSGSPWSRFYNRFVAEACTQCGVWLIQQTIDAARAQGLNVIYGDTDSVFVTGCSDARFEEFVAWANDDLYTRLLTQQGCREQRIELAYEKKFERMVFVSAKRYAGRYAHYKGTAAKLDDPKALEVKGLEYKRGDSIRLARQLQEEVAQKLMTERCEDPKEFERVLVDWEVQLKMRALDPDDVMIAKRLTKSIDGYKRKQKKDGTFARQLPHIEIARELRERGEDMGEGAKVRYFPTNGAAKPKEYLPEQDWQGDHQVDRYELWDALVAPPTVRLLRAAFPAHPWAGFLKTRPKAPRKRRKAPPKGPPNPSVGAPAAPGAPTAHPPPQSGPKGAPSAPVGPPRRTRRQAARATRVKGKPGLPSHGPVSVHATCRRTTTTTTSRMPCVGCVAAATEPNTMDDARVSVSWPGAAIWGQAGASPGAGCPGPSKVRRNKLGNDEPTVTRARRCDLRSSSSSWTSTGARPPGG